MLNLLRCPDSASKVQKTVALSAASMTSLFLNVILQMLIARYLSKTEVAVYMQSLLIYSTLLPFLQLGVNSGLYYVLTHKEGHSREVMTEGMVIVGSAGLVVSLIIIIGGNELIASFMNNYNLSYTTFWLIPYMLICIPESLAFVGFIFCNRVRFVAYYNTIKSLACVLLLVIVIIYNDSGTVLFIARVISGCLFGICSIFLLYVYVLPKDSFQFQWSGIKTILAVSLPLSFATMAGTMSGNLDMLIVSRFFSVDDFSVYRMGAYELPFVGIITGAISTVVTVDMNREAKNGDIVKAIEIFKNVAVKTSLILMPSMVFFFFAAQDFITFMFTEDYLGAVPIFCLYLLYLPVRCVIYGPLFVALGKSKIIMKREFTALMLNAVLSLVAIHVLGMIGAVVSTLMVTYLYSVPYNIYLLSKWSGVSWYKILPFRRIGGCILLSLPGGLLAWQTASVFYTWHSLLKLMLMFCVFALTTMLMYYRYLHLSPQKLRNIIR